MDRVFIKNLEIETIIGIYHWEREKRQRVVFDIEMAWDNKRPAASENIDDALNYKTLSDEIKETVSASQYQLIETLAEKIAELVLDNYGVEWLQLTLRKPDALDGDTDVGVKIVRTQTKSKVRPGFLA